jgi:hypothetical protein
LRASVCNAAITSSTINSRSIRGFISSAPATLPAEPQPAIAPLSNAPDISMRIGKSTVEAGPS